MRDFTIVSDGIDHPALARLARLDRPVAAVGVSHKMGYQPTLDGVRAISVLAVILYHAGFSWLHGGFFGVEVFFVVSGFLITSLLIEERDGAGRVSLREFWVRRWRRLLPALFTMMIAVGVWAVFWGTAEQHTQLRRDYPWAILYLANWGQIASDQPYFSGTPTLFRHLWSLAVEEQWYVVWPLVFVAVARARRGGADRRLGVWIAVVAVAVMAGTAAMRVAEWPARAGDGGSFNTNFLYLSTITRSSGLLLGAAMAFVWRPWRAPERSRGSAPRVLNAVALAAVAVLVVSFVIGRVDANATYLWLLPLVTIASAVLVGVVVHPWAGAARTVFGWRPLVEVGKRSYGLYLWSWPISRIVGAYEGSPAKFALAMAITVPVSEACYRWVETPIRRGALGNWWRGRERRDWRLVTACGVATSLVLAVSLGAFFATRDKVFDPAADASNDDVVFDLSATGADGSTSTVPAVVNDSRPADTVVADTAAATTTTAPAPPTTLATLPRRLVIVGDSTAHSLAINLPDGIESTFVIGDGSVEGCSVYSDGTAVSSRNFTRSFDGCDGWEQRWVNDAQEIDAEVALVVIGAWDVFDVRQPDGTTLVFGTPENDARFVAGVQAGIDALSAAGVKVALLEIPCMRPTDVEGAGVPALPERGDDTRVAHLNDLLRQVA
ncbi:MAG TPA: hypothetical protein DCR14_02240, partial [Acidimicrobiaceae bacterium]|nr:hypothetical protein [Acidimicrobiaceae bacterium]